MASGYSPLWLRLLHKVPGLFKVCPDGNYHWFTDPYCFCRRNDHSGEWRGGVYCFAHDHELSYVPGMRRWKCYGGGV